MFERPACHDVATTAKGHLLHLISKHSYRRRSSWYLNEESVCRICMTDFHCMSKLALHLQACNGKVSRCLHQLTLSQPKCTEMQAEHHQDIMSQERKVNVQAGNNVTYFEKPPKPLAGPLPQVLHGVCDFRATYLEGEARIPFSLKGICIDVS